MVDNWTKRSKDIPWESIDWIRASDIPDFLNEEGEITILTDDIHPSDVQAGMLSDAYFLSVLSALAE